MKSKRSVYDSVFSLSLYESSLGVVRVRLSPTVTQLAVALDVEHDSISHLFFYCDGPALRGGEREIWSDYCIIQSLHALLRRLLLIPIWTGLIRATGGMDAEMSSPMTVQPLPSPVSLFLCFHTILWNCHQIIGREEGQWRISKFRTFLIDHGASALIFRKEMEGLVFRWLIRDRASIFPLLTPELVVGPSATNEKRGSDPLRWRCHHFAHAAVTRLFSFSQSVYQLSVTLETSARIWIYRTERRRSKSCFFFFFFVPGPIPGGRYDMSLMMGDLCCTLRWKFTCFFSISSSSPFCVFQSRQRVDRRKGRKHQICVEGGGRSRVENGWVERDKALEHLKASQASCRPPFRDDSTTTAIGWKGSIKESVRLVLHRRALQLRPVGRERRKKRRRREETSLDAILVVVDMVVIVARQLMIDSYSSSDVIPKEEKKEGRHPFRMTVSSAFSWSSLNRCVISTNFMMMMRLVSVFSFGPSP